MILYKFSMDNEGITREELRAIEKNNNFYEKYDETTFVCKKSNLNVISYIDGNAEMISLSGNPEYFVKEIIKHKKEELKDEKNDSHNIKKCIKRLERTYNGIIVNRVDDFSYTAAGYIDFEHITGKPQGVLSMFPDNSKKVPIFKVISGDALLSKIHKGDTFVVNNVFMNGNATNISIDKFSKGKNGHCILSVDEFGDLNKRNKMEIDIEEL